MRYIVRTFAYFFIMIIQKIRNRTVIFEYGTQVAINATFEGKNKLSHHAFFNGKLGFASYIGAHSVIVGKIGKYCSIADRVTFLSATHPVENFVSTHPSFYSIRKQSGFSYTEEQLFDELPTLDGSKYSIEVGNDVYIGYGVTVIGPCRIGNGAVVAAGAVVTNDVPEFAIVGGVPAKVIRYRFTEEQIDFLNKLQWWDRPQEWLRERVTQFTSIGKMINDYEYREE